MIKLINFIDRPESIVTGKKNLKHLYTFKNFPVFFGCVDTPESQDLYADMDWGIDMDTGVVQLTKLIPLEILYQSQHVDGCGPTWKKYYEDLSKYILSNNLRKVLEIGGGQGQLAEIATAKSDKLAWTIIEPNPTHKGNKQIKVLPRFFDENFKSKEKVDAVVFSQLLEHIYEPKKFLGAIAGYLKPGGKLIFAYPNLYLWLRRKYTNALNFEHTMFLTDYFVDYLLKEAGFTITNKKKYKDHSYFYVAVKGVKKRKSKFTNHYKRYKRVFVDFVTYHRRMVTGLNKKIDSSKEPVYCFGAHIFTIYLIAFGLKTKEIVKILDNSPTKRGKRLYGTSLFVDSPKILRGKGVVNVILKAGIYNEEIKKDILENINPEVVFW